MSDNDNGDMDKGDMDKGDDFIEVEGEGDYPEEEDQGYDDEGSDSDSSGDDGPLPADHPLMDRVQRGIFNDLSKQDEKLALDLREKTEELGAVKKNRESIGVELYGFQQGLAKLQMRLEKAHDNYSAVFQSRVEVEKDLKSMAAKNDGRLEEKDMLFKKRDETRKELDKMMITVRQVEDYNEINKSEILVTRRAAYRTEDAMQRLEKRKKQQDSLIDQLNEQLRHAKEQLKIYEGQVRSQMEETQAAKETLAEATREMELIAVEKREYLQKWKSSLIGMANRDVALKAAEDAILAQHEELSNLELQIKGYKTQIKKEQNENEKLTAILNKTEAETKFINTQLTTLGEQRRDLNQKYVMLRDTLERTDRELAAAQQTQRDVKAEIQHVHKKYEKMMLEKQALDDQIMENLSNQTTIEKGAQNVWKITQKLKDNIHEKEMKMGEIQNEVARIKVDALNTNAHNKELEQTLGAYDKELKEKDKLIEKYELEIRQRHDKIEKKQIYIARLNRKYEQLMSNQQDENTGPLEATIKNLQKEISTINKDSGELQRQWIKSQTELVALVSDTNQQSDKVAEIQARETILTQKKLRLTADHNQIITEIKELQKMVKTMHNDMAKLNDLIAKNTKLQENLANENYTKETEFMNKLKELELSSVKVDASIQRLKEEKESVFNEIIEVEKHIMLWEKKIQLERETQEALDPEYGQPEIKGMQKEIHRMRLRLAQLKRQQEKMIQEMERTIAKRETIRMTNIGARSKKQKSYTQASLKKKISGLKSGLQENIKDSKKAVHEISRQEEQNQKLLHELEKRQASYSQVEDKTRELGNQTDDWYFTKQMNLETLLMFRKRTQKYQDMLDGKYRCSEDREKTAGDIQRQEEKFQRIREAIAKLSEENPKYEAWFKRLLQMT